MSQSYDDQIEGSTEGEAPAEALDASSDDPEVDEADETAEVTDAVRRPRRRGR